MVLVVADAGYGKTTLLADFARRTKVRTLWLHLDETDRDWVSFLAHLIAAGREDVSGFGAGTAELLMQAGVSEVSRDSAIDRMMNELLTITDGGAVLVLDDYHFVDDADDAQHVVRELVERGPDRLSIVFSSRHRPSVPLAKLRAMGEVAELGPDELRFDFAETTRLFADTYRRPLDPDVLSDLMARTEGWVASLELVQAALRDRSPADVRRFIRGLTGAERTLYDYLAEVVVADLPDATQRFLMATSILQVVTPRMAEVVTGNPPKTPPG